MKLTDTQLILLGEASNREDRAIVVADRLKGGAAAKVIESLLKAELVEEVAAAGTLPVWRRDDDGASFALVITQAGLKAINASDAGPSDAAHTANDGIAAADASTAGLSAGDAGRRKSAGVKKASVATEAHPGRRPAVTNLSAKPPRDSDARSGSKQDRVLIMLKSKGGTTVAAIMKATGWQPHSVRGFFSGVVRKKLQLDLASNGEGERRVYRIGPVAPSSRGRAAKGN